MNTYIALFRGINVGGKNILKMKDLTGILEALRLGKIQTYIQSGNVVFQSADNRTDTLANEIASSVCESHGFTPKVRLLERSELQDIIENCPFKAVEGKALHCFFLDSEPVKPDLDGLMSVKLESEEIALRKRAFYLHAPDGIGRSKLAAKVERCLGVPVTARNWNTVNKLMLMVE